MKWEKGRQKATESVQKFKLFSGKTWDCYLLKIPAGSNVDAHVDKVEGKEHHRFNLTLWGFWEVSIKDYKPAESPIFQSFLQYHLFRPDIQEHSAKIYTNTLLISIGWVK